MKTLEETQRCVFIGWHNRPLWSEAQKKPCADCTSCFFFFFSSPSHFHRKPCQSCDLVWHLEAPQGTCSAHSSERKLGNLENSDVKTTFVEQTVPQRAMERERKHYYSLWGPLWAEEEDEREMLSVCQAEAWHAHTHAHTHRNTTKFNWAEWRDCWVQ